MMPSAEKYHPSIYEEFQLFFEAKQIEEYFTEQSLANLHDAFLAAENEEMDSDQLYDAFKNILQFEISKDDFQVLFRKINIKLDGKVTWDEFISYLLVRFQEKDISLKLQLLEMPLTDLPRMLRSRHRTPVCKIIFCPEVLPDRSTSFHSGCYLTVSREGVINYWSLDFEYERTVYSKNPYLKVQPTAITDLIVLPDVQIVCTSSTECDLRFYDAAAKKFDLHLLISSLENAVVCMYYYFSTNMKEDSYIVLGDMSGSVIIISFNPTERGPFKHHTTGDTIVLRYGEVAKGELRGCNVTEFKNVHTNWTSQVAYYGNLRSFVSSSQCAECSLCVFSLDTTERMQYKFKILMGISCFTVCKDSHILVTGGPDCIVRVWNPFVPRKANIVFTGHRSTICALVVIDNGNRIYSLSKDRCIKVWDVPTQNCIQTYNKLPSELCEYSPMTIVFNTLTRTMIIASVMIAILVCEHVINKEASDGYTHTKGVSCILYSNLFKLIVSTGLDSCIIIWDPWSGRRLRLISHAHTILQYGQHVNIEITAACFDESEHYLVTGARNGSIKIWNFNTGVCVRETLIDRHCEITSLVWHENRILCCGWTKQITELAAFAEDVCKKDWITNHTDHILCSAAKLPQMLATGTYNGELIFWRIETGQPLKMYQIVDVSKRYTTATWKRNKTVKRLNMIDKLSIVQQTKFLPSPHQKSALNIIHDVAVRGMIFLNTREPKPNVGTLLIALDSGLVQVWTHHPTAGFLGAFSVIHTVGDCATSLATDANNEFLVTGHSVGYIKVWLLSNYMLPDPPKACMPLLRLKFPFLWKDKILGRAKRAVRGQKLPVLLSSVRAHMQGIISLQIISSAQIILSGSADHTVRLWSFGGRYISTLGTFRNWISIVPTVSVEKYFQDYRFPPDIKRFASSTTFKVLNGGMKRIPVEIETEEIDMPKEIYEGERHLLFGKEFNREVLENYYELQVPSKIYHEHLKLDSTFPYIPIYTHLSTFPLKSIKAEKGTVGEKMELMYGFSFCIVEKIKNHFQEEQKNQHYVFLERANEMFAKSSQLEFIKLANYL